MPESGIGVHCGRGPRPVGGAATVVGVPSPPRRPAPAGESGARAAPVARFRLGDRVLLVAPAPCEPALDRDGDVVGELTLEGKCYVVLASAPRVGRVDRSALDRLTPRELQIAQQVARGRPTKSIAYDLRISEWTVLSYIQRIFAKLGVKNRAAMVFQCAALFLAEGEPHDVGGTDDGSRR